MSNEAFRTKQVYNWKTAKIGLNFLFFFLICLFNLIKFKFFPCNYENNKVIRFEGCSWFRNYKKIYPTYVRKNSREFYYVLLLRRNADSKRLLTFLLIRSLHSLSQDSNLAPYTIHFWMQIRNVCLPSYLLGHYIPLVGIPT